MKKILTIMILIAILLLSYHTKTIEWNLNKIEMNLTDISKDVLENKTKLYEKQIYNSKVNLVNKNEIDYITDVNFIWFWKEDSLIFKCVNKNFCDKTFYEFYNDNYIKYDK